MILKMFCAIYSIVLNDLVPGECLNDKSKDHYQWCINFSRRSVGASI